MTLQLKSGLMIKRVFLKFGPFGAGVPLAFEPSAMTVFVGPNNSGKSLVLRELQQYAEQGPQQTRLIVEGIELILPSDDGVHQLLEGRRSRRKHTSNPVPEGHLRLARTLTTGDAPSYQDVDPDRMIQRISSARQTQPQKDEAWKELWPGVFSQLVSFYTVALDGRTRLGLVDERNLGDLLEAPAHHLAALFQDEAARKRVRDIVMAAFSQYLVLDPTNAGKVRVRLSARAPEDPDEEQSLSERARKFHQAATLLSDLSDGVRAFTGLVSVLVSSDYRIMMVDEAEAFLHPPLARRLGSEMTSLAADRQGNVFASTHSADFVMGCVESGKPVTIVRLTYDGSNATARLLGGGELEDLMRDPLLRSTGVLKALFHSGAVVTEADPDRAFYEEINHRLSAAEKPAIKDSAFLNSQNKQTIRRLVAPLRNMGIPAAAVVDFDVLKGSDLRDLLAACSAPDAVRQGIGQLRGQVEGYFDGDRSKMKTAGITALKGEQREACQKLLDDLASYGVFVVPNGELETWLAPLGAGASKGNWLPSVFEAMKSDPADPDYVQPAKGDVWQFVSSIGEWIADPDRQGMPREG